MHPCQALSRSFWALTSMGGELAKRIRELRRSRDGQSIADFARDLDVSPKSISNYELGHRAPDIDFLANLALLTGAPLRELIAMRLKELGFESQASMVKDQPGHYGFSDPNHCSSHARRAVLNAGDLDPAWSLAIMELATRGDISPSGVDRLIEFIKEREGDAG